MHALRAAFAAVTIAGFVWSAAGAHPAILKLKLFAQNRPGETGTATLEQVPGGVQVVVKMAGGQNGTQPVHIHKGTCAKLDPPTYVLADLVHGASTTKLSGVSLDRLLGGHYVIDVHESSADIKRYVACAPIVQR